MAQKANPVTDGFFCTDEAGISGHKNGLLTAARRSAPSNLTGWRNTAATPRI